MKKILVSSLAIFLLLCSSCDLNPFAPKTEPQTTSVEISVIDETGTLSGDFIKSIYDPANEQDFRYSQYDASRYVKFTNVEAGSYRAHACPVSPNNGNWVDITVANGEHYSITFTYYTDAYFVYNGISYPHRWWKHSLSKT